MVVVAAVVVVVVDVVVHDDHTADDVVVVIDGGGVDSGVVVDSVDSLGDAVGGAVGAVGGGDVDTAPPSPSPSLSRARSVCWPRDDSGACRRPLRKCVSPGRGRYDALEGSDSFKGGES